MARRRRSARGAGRFRLTSGAIAALLLAVGAGAVLWLPQPRQNAQGVQATGDDAIAAGKRAGGGVLEAFSDFGARMNAALNAADKVRALEKENQQLREWKETALALAERQQRYEKLLNIPRENLGQSQGGGEQVTARLILDPGGPFKRTLLANAGSDHGVKVGDIALNENGLIGRVISVGRRSARVLLLDDYNSRVPVMGETSRARAMLIGQAAQKPRLDLGPVRLSDPGLQYVVGQGGFRRNERVVTSGDGGIYPRGILIGKAAEDSGGWTVELGAARQSIDYIRLIPSFSPDLPPDEGASEQSLPRPPQTLYSGAALPAPLPAPPPRPKSVVKPSVATAATEHVAGPQE
ncbi:MAG: rod shape-determining protein MreC [Pseudomonadota bacterium]